jgi:hypothetical protein
VCVPASALHRDDHRSCDRLTTIYSDDHQYNRSKREATGTRSRGEERCARGRGEERGRREEIKSGKRLYNSIKRNRKEHRKYKHQY